MEQQLLEQKIANLYKQIREAKNVDFAFEYISELIKINEIVGEMIFVNNVKVSAKLWQFFKDFDLSYETNMHEFFFNKIKNGEYVI